MKRAHYFVERPSPRPTAPGRLCLFVLITGAIIAIMGLASCSSLFPRRDDPMRESRAEAVAEPSFPPRVSRAAGEPLLKTPGEAPVAPTPATPSQPVNGGAEAEEKKGAGPDEPEAPQARPMIVKAEPAPESEKGKEDIQYIMLNFENAKLPDVVRTIMEILGHNYIIDPQISGVVNIHTSGKVARGDLFPILETLLKIHHATVVKEGELYHVSPIGPGKGIVPHIVPQGDLLPGDTLIIQVIPLHFIPAVEMANILKSFLSPGALMFPYAKENLLLIMDYASTIRRFLSMVDIFDIDIFQKVQIKMYPLRYALALDVATEVQQIFDAYELPSKSGRGVGVQFIPIERLNAILAISSFPGMLDQVDKWMGHLDQISLDSIIRVFVYRCQNQLAADITGVLTAVYGQREKSGTGQAGVGSKTSSRSGGGRAPAPPAPDAPIMGPAIPGTPPPPTAPAAPPARTSARPPSSASGGAPAKAAEPAPEAPAAAAPAPPAPSAPEAPSTATPSAAQGGRVEPMADVTGEVSFYVDTVTNSIITRASERDYLTVLKTIQQLDIFPRQVLIEVVVADISLDESLSMGVEWQKFGKIDSGSYALGFLGGASTVVPGLEYTVVKTGELTAALRSVAADNKVNILSSPHIMASDNQSASINVSDEIPIITGQVTTTDATAGDAGVKTVDQTVEYRSAGIILTVTPHINDMGLVRMEIQQTVSEVSDKTVAGVNAPVIFNRTASTTLTVNDGQTIVIGGLIREKKDRVRSGVPFLYRIPVFGFLFGFDSRQYNKTELMILITPHVIRSLNDAEAMTREFHNKVKDIKASMKLIQD